MPRRTGSRRTVGRALLRRPRAIFRLLTDARAPRLPRIVALLAVLYVVMPIDLVPDFAPVIGWIDDVGLATLALAYVSASAARLERRLAEEEHDLPTTAVPG